MPTDDIAYQMGAVVIIALVIILATTMVMCALDEIRTEMIEDDPTYYDDI
jgi:hypothetical protein